MMIMRSLSSPSYFLSTFFKFVTPVTSMVVAIVSILCIVLQRHKCFFVLVH